MNPTPTTHDSSLTRAFSALRQDFASTPAPVSLDDAVLAAFRQRHAPRPALVNPLRQIFNWFKQERALWMPLSAACAVALLAVLTLRPAVVPSHPNAARVASAAVVAGDPNAVPSPVGSGELATAFFPVGNPTQVEAAEHARMVRIQLPRSVLAGYGLPVDPELADQPIDADVLVNDQGQTIALRFVRPKRHLM